MISGMGDAAAKFASRGVQGNSLGKMLITNQSQFGLSQAMRTRGLIMAYSEAEKQKAYTRNQLKAQQNRSFSKVALNPIPDVAKPPPTMGNPGMALMLGMGQALAAGIGGMDDKTMSNNEETSTVPEAPPEAPPTQETSYDYGNTYPAGSFGYGSAASRSGLLVNRQLYL